MEEIKKKRGRPPKDKSIIKIPIKKEKRGRPKKNKEIIKETQVVKVNEAIFTTCFFCKRKLSTSEYKFMCLGINRETKIPVSLYTHKLCLNRFNGETLIPIGDCSL